MDDNWYECTINATSKQVNMIFAVTSKLLSICGDPCVETAEGYLVCKDIKGMLKTEIKDAKAATNAMLEEIDRNSLGNYLYTIRTFTMFCKTIRKNLLSNIDNNKMFLIDDMLENQVIIYVKNRIFYRPYCTKITKIIPINSTRCYKDFPIKFFYKKSYVTGFINELKLISRSSEEINCNLADYNILFLNSDLEDAKRSLVLIKIKNEIFIKKESEVNLIDVNLMNSMYSIPHFKHLDILVDGYDDLTVYKSIELSEGTGTDQWYIEKQSPLKDSKLISHGKETIEIGVQKLMSLGNIILFGGLSLISVTTLIILTGYCNIIKQIGRCMTMIFRNCKKERLPLETTVRFETNPTAPMLPTNSTNDIATVTLVRRDSMGSFARNWSFWKPKFGQ
jgi:hypothetical protein